MRYLIIFAVGFTLGAACLGMLIDGADLDLRIQQYELQKKQDKEDREDIERFRHRLIIPPNQQSHTKGDWI
jgi:hypothetical protein